MPAERHELPALQAAGFTGYLVKPIRVASLAERFDIVSLDQIADAIREARSVPRGCAITFDDGYSGAYKYGLPVDADLVVDVRFLPNPHWVPELRPLSGLDASVRDYVLGQQAASAFLAAYLEKRARMG